MYKKIKEGLFLCFQALSLSKKKDNVEFKRTPVNNFVLIDRSGSMYGLIRSVVQQVKDQLDKMNEDDFITIGWYSSEGGEFGWVCKGAPVKNKEAVKQLLDKYASTVGTTCFSEILTDLETVISDLSVFSKVFNFFLMTDGYPVVSNYKAEVKRIKEVLARLSGKLANAYFVGQGDYYNRELMQEMAQIANGTLLHSSSLADFDMHLASFNKNGENVEPKVAIDTPKNVQHVLCTLTPNDVASYNLGDEKILVNPESNLMVWLAENPVGTETKDTEDYQRAAYAASRALLQAGNYQLAENILSVLGDVAAVAKATNSFTIGEYGALENELLQANKSAEVRFANGRKEGVVPPDDVFCMLDFINMVTSDNTATFLPYHPDFKYKKIGRSSKQLDGYPKFNADKDYGCPMSTFVWSSDKLNSSVLAKIYGTVELGDDAPDYGLQKTHKCFIWRNYSLVSDGRRNVDMLPMSDVSGEVLEKLMSVGAVNKIHNGVVLVDLTKIPVINRKLANSYRDLNVVCDAVLREKQLQAQVKVFKSEFNAFPDEIKEQVIKLVRGTEFTDAQIEYLAKYGVQKDNSFAPPKESLPSTDVMYVNTFEFDIDKAKSLPSVADVKKKMAEGKKLNIAASWMADAINKVDANNDSPAMKAVWLKETIDKINAELRQLRAKINAAKFAVIVGKSNFEQLPKLDNHNTYSYNGFDFLIEVNSNVEVRI